MSYHYHVIEPVIVHQRFKQMCWEHDRSPSLHSAQEIISEEFHAASFPIYKQGAQGVEIQGGPRVPEYLGIQGVVEVVTETILKYADPGVYTIEDEYAHKRTVTIS